MTDEVCDAISKVPARAWTPAYDGDGQVRDGAWVAELTGLLDPDRLAEGHAGHRPEGTPAPGRAAAVHRHRRPPVHLLRHQRQHRAARRPGTTAPPPGPLRGPHPHAPRTPGYGTCRCTATTRTRSGARSSPWPATCWPGPRCSPSPAPPGAGNLRRLRLRIFSCAGRIVRGGRRLRLRLAARWPWAPQITAAISRLQALAPG